MKNLLQQIENTLNAASEMFLLIAVVGLLALPFAIAGNLNPIASQTAQFVDTTPKSVLGVTSKTKIPITSDSSISYSQADKNIAEVVLEKNQPNDYVIGVLAKKNLAENIYHIVNKGTTSVTIKPSLNIGKANPDGVVIKINAISYSYNTIPAITMAPGDQIEIGLEVSKQKVYPVKIDLGLSL